MREDVELLRMAAFKLKEAAGRLKGLARQAKAPATRTRLESTAAKLTSWESELWGSPEQDDEPASPPPDPAQRSRRSAR